MAGSLKHVEHGWSLIENMGDAYEAVEELLYLVKFFVPESDAAQALEVFNAYKRGDVEPDPNTRNGAAYLATLTAMES